MDKYINTWKVCTVLYKVYTVYTHTQPIPFSLANGIQETSVGESCLKSIQWLKNHTLWIWPCSKKTFSDLAKPLHIICILQFHIMSL